MSYLQNLPEFLAIATFLPMGSILGYALYFAIAARTNVFVFSIEFWPFFLAAMSAGFSCVIMAIIKAVYKKYKFEHFYLMTMGMVCHLIGGSLMINSWFSSYAISFCFVGNGLCYIPALTYINIRSSATSMRLLKISMAHFVYFLGVATAATITMTCARNHRNFTRNLLRSNTGVGTLIVVSATLLLIGYAINEAMHYYCPAHNYKKSLDPNVERENEAAELLNNKVFEIDGKSSDYGQFQTDDLQKIPRKRAIGLVCFAILSRVMSILSFYFPFIYLNHFTMWTLFRGDGYYIIHWMALVGLFIGAIMLQMYSAKIVFYITVVLMIVTLFIQTLAISSLNFPSSFAITMIWLSYFIYGFGYSFADTISLQMVRLRYNEIIHTIGFAAEMLTIGALLFSVLAYPSNWFCFHSRANCLLTSSPDCARYCGNSMSLIIGHSMFFMPMLVILIIIAYFVLSHIESKLSLLEARNMIIFKINRQLMNNSVIAGMINPAGPTVSAAAQTYVTPAADTKENLVVNDVTHSEYIRPGQIAALKEMDGGYTGGNEPNDSGLPSYNEAEQPPVYASPIMK